LTWTCLSVTVMVGGGVSQSSGMPTRPIQTAPFQITDERGAEIAEEMYQLLLDAPIPLQVGTLYEQWWKMRNIVVKTAAAYRREKK
jgi:hypothetical protein